MPAVVPKSKTANAGRYQYKYASLADTLRVIEETYGYRIEQTVNVLDDGTRVAMTRYCTQNDEGVWGEWSGWLAPIPILAGSGNGANAMQQFGASLTYARRYSLQTALGMAADDTDGLEQQKNTPAVREQVAHIQELLQRNGIADKENAMRVYLHALAGRDVAKSSDLTVGQAEKVIHLLEQMAKGEGGA